jgi:hypothetical protein
MTVFRSILLTAFIFWPLTGWTQVFTSPQPGMLRGVGMMPEMQRGLVSPGPTVGPQSRVIPGSPGANYPGSGFDDNSGSENYSAGGPDSDGMNDPRLQYGPATEGYPTRGNANDQRGGPSGRSPDRAPRNAMSLSVTRHSLSTSGGYFGILGAIAKPAVYFQKSDRVLLIELVKLAGGTNDDASGSVRIVRQGRAGMQTFLTETSAFEVLNGDVIYFDSQRMATQSGVHDFSQPLRSVNGGPRNPASKPAGTRTGDPVVTQKGMNPAQAYLAFVGLTTHPIIVPVPANEATLSAAMMWLQQDRSSVPLPKVLSPIPVPRAGSGQQNLEQLLPSGTVLVFDPQAVNQAVLPDFPPVIGELPAADHNGEATDNQTAVPSRQDSKAGIRVTAPVPAPYRTSRTSRPEFRTNSVRPRATEAPVQDSEQKPAERGTQRPRPKSAVVDQGEVDAGTTRPGDASFEGATRTSSRIPHEGGPMLFSPGSRDTDQPHARSPKELPRNVRSPDADQRVMPAEVNQGQVETATPAAYQEEPAVIPQGPLFGQPARQAGDWVEPRHFNAIEEPEAHFHQHELQKAAAPSDAESPVSAEELAKNKIPMPSPTPWYASTIGMVWLTSCLFIVVFVGLWVMSRSGTRQKLRIQSEPLDDLLNNRLKVTTETVRPPLGLRFHARPQPQAATGTTVPVPHLVRTHFRTNATPSGTNPSPTTAVQKTISPATKPESDLPKPAASISEQERKLREEFQQAWLQRSRQVPTTATGQDTASQSSTAVPGETNVQSQLPPPHFAARPKILANVPRVNLTPNQTANTMQPHPNAAPNADESSALGRALANRRPIN